jgi:hypothetical protein
MSILRTLKAISIMINFGTQVTKNLMNLEEDWESYNNETHNKKRGKGRVIMHETT